eukprot:1165169-Rhodomonas_salina.1
MSKGSILGSQCNIPYVRYGARTSDVLTVTELRPFGAHHLWEHCLLTVGRILRLGRIFQCPVPTEKLCIRVLVAEFPGKHFYEFRGTPVGESLPEYPGYPSKPPVHDVRSPRKWQAPQGHVYNDKGMTCQKRGFVAKLGSNKLESWNVRLRYEKDCRAAIRQRIHKHTPLPISQHASSLSNDYPKPAAMKLALVILLALNLLPTAVHGHGELLYPMSRNVDEARKIQSGYCPHC